VYQKTFRCKTQLKEESGTGAKGAATIDAGSLFNVIFNVIKNLKIAKCGTNFT
jgi:hypothetical protein